jgi:Tol biopolymer transport system component
MNLKKQGTLLLMLLSLVVLASCDSGSGPASPAKSKLNGSGPAQLTATARMVKVGGDMFQQYWPSPDGSKVVIENKKESDDYYKFGLVNLMRDGVSTPISTTAQPAMPVNVLSWTPDGTAFAFSVVSRGSQLVGTIYIYDIQKGSDLTVTVSSDVLATGEPVWNSKGDTLYFLATKKNGTDLMQASRDGRQVTTLFNVVNGNDPIVRSYTYTPDDKQFIFNLQAKDATTSTTYIADVKATNRRLLNEGPQVRALQVSPRGDSILIEQLPDNRNITANVTYTLSYILPFDPSLAHRGAFLPAPILTDTSKIRGGLVDESVAATWSPDGDKIAYLGEYLAPDSTFISSILVANADGSQATEVYSTTDVLTPPTSGVLNWSSNDNIVSWDGKDSFTVIQLKKK